MSGPGVVWFVIFGLGCPLGIATTILYGAPAWVLLSLLLVPLLYVLARVLFSVYP